jgi:hypothetical protein
MNNWFGSHDDFAETILEIMANYEPGNILTKTIWNCLHLPKIKSACIAYLILDHLFSANNETQLCCSIPVIIFEFVSNSSKIIQSLERLNYLR